MWAELGGWGERLRRGRRSQRVVLGSAGRGGGAAGGVSVGLRAAGAPGLVAFVVAVVAASHVVAFVVVAAVECVVAVVVVVVVVAVFVVVTVAEFDVVVFVVVEVVAAVVVVAVVEVVAADVVAVVEVVVADVVDVVDVVADAVVAVVVVVVEVVPVVLGSVDEFGIAVVSSQKWVEFGGVVTGDGGWSGEGDGEMCSSEERRLCPENSLQTLRAESEKTQWTIITISSVCCTQDLEHVHIWMIPQELQLKSLEYIVALGIPHTVCVYIVALGIPYVG